MRGAFLDHQPVDDVRDPVEPAQRATLDTLHPESAGGAVQRGDRGVGKRIVGVHHVVLAALDRAMCKVSEEPRPQRPWEAHHRNPIERDAGIVRLPTVREDVELELARPCHARDGFLRVPLASARKSEFLHENGDTRPASGLGGELLARAPFDRGGGHRQSGDDRAERHRVRISWRVQRCGREPHQNAAEHTHSKWRRAGGCNGRCDNARDDREQEHGSDRTQLAQH